MRLQNSYLPSMRKRSMHNSYYAEIKLNNVLCRCSNGVISGDGIL